jgi:hypothetical protein
MKHVQEKVYMTVAKRAYRTIGLPMDATYTSMKGRINLLIEVQALGIL